MAASAPPPPPPPPPGPGLMPNLGKSDPSTNIYAPAEASSRMENPGTIEDLHKKCKGTSSEHVSQSLSIPRFLFELTLMFFHFITENLPLNDFLDNQLLIYNVPCLNGFPHCPYYIYYIFL